MNEVMKNWYYLDKKKPDIKSGCDYVFSKTIKFR